MSQELALGQRTGKMILDSAWEDGEMGLLADAKLSQDEVIRHWVINGGGVTLNAAIGDLLTMRTNGTVERNRPNQTQEEADADVRADVQSNGVFGKPEHVSNLISKNSATE